MGVKKQKTPGDATPIEPPLEVEEGGEVRLYVSAQIIDGVIVRWGVGGRQAEIQRADGEIELFDSPDEFGAVQLALEAVHNAPQGEE